MTAVLNSVENVKDEQAILANSEVQSINQVAEYFSKEFIEQTKKLFEPIAGRELSNEECAEIARQAIEMELYLQGLRMKYGKNKRN